MKCFSRWFFGGEGRQYLQLICFLGVILLILVGWLVGFAFILIWPFRAETGISNGRQRNAGLEH